MGKEFDLGSMMKLKSTVEKCIAELSDKDDLNPQETRALLDGMNLRKELCEEIEECKMKEDYDYSEKRYSRHGSSYGYSEKPMHDVNGWYQNSMTNGYSGYPGYPMEHMTASYNMPNYYDNNYSERRGRGYSRHSIGDRIISMMEKEMDHTESDYEKEQLHKFIRMIRMAADEG